MAPATTKEISLERILTRELEKGSSPICCRRANGEGVGSEGRRTFFGKDVSFWLLMTASSAALMLGLSSGSLLGRYYYVHGGSRKWLYTWIQSAGWPILIVPLVIGYWRRNPSTNPLRTIITLRPTHSLTWRLCLIYTVLGALVTLDNLLYSLGTSYLPVSTNFLLCSSQLAFNALFAYLLVAQQLSSYTINAIVIITLGTILVGVDADSNKPHGITKKEYIVGIVVTIAASGIFALLLPLLQLVYACGDVQKARNARAETSTLSTVRPTSTPLSGSILQHSTVAASSSRASTIPSFLLVLEVQIAINVAASIFAFVGMCINADLAAMHAEAHHFDGGKEVYIAVLVCTAVGWQVYILGSFGIVFLSSSLMSCVFSTVMIPILPALAVFFFHDSFTATKGLAMALSVWGFISYIYDGYVGHCESKKDNLAP